MNRNTNHRQPTIPSPGTRRLASHMRSIRRRNPNLSDTINAIRSGDEHALHELVSGAQHGDADAAVTAIWALLPRLAAVVISRVPVGEWQAAMDDYLTVAYLALVDVDLAVPPDYLSDKVIARTRRRIERSRVDRPLVLMQPTTIALLAPFTNDVADRAIARAELEALAGAVSDGLLDPESWHTLLELRFNSEPGTASARQRKSASRARVRLQEWAGRAA